MVIDIVRYDFVNLYKINWIDGMWKELNSNKIKCVSSLILNFFLLIIGSFC